MIELIAGDKGTGKTKMLMGKANNDIKVVGGNIIYMDQNNKHMYELSNRVHLINIPEFHIDSTDRFIGFLYGVVSQNENLDKIFLDNFLTIANLKNVTEADACVKELEVISDKYEVDFVIALSIKKDDLTEDLQKLVTIAL